MLLSKKSLYCKVARGSRPCVARAVAQAQAPTSNVATEQKHRKLELLQLVTGLNRGALATEKDATEIAVAIKLLEDAGFPALQALDGPSIEAALQGKWQLLYSTAESFRSSPFFWAFSEGLVGDSTVASAIFKFTDSIPGAEVGQAFQTFDFVTGKLISEVDLEVFPGAKGTVVTTCSVQLDSPPTRLSVCVENTRVAGSNLLPSLLDAVVVPVKDVIEGLRGSGSTRVAAELTYLDHNLRIIRTLSDGKVFMYRKVVK